MVVLGGGAVSYERGTPVAALTALSHIKFGSVCLKAFANAQGVRAGGSMLKKGLGCGTVFNKSRMCSSDLGSQQRPLGGEALGSPRFRVKRAQLKRLKDS